VIQVRDLTKQYGSVNAVNGISFDVEKGEIVGFLGPNGAGKSTTLRMLTGYLSPTRGSVEIDGIPSHLRPVAARKKIGYMPEACPLYLEMRVVEFLRYRAELKAVPSRQRKARVEQAMEQAQVEDVQQRIIGQLSKGYRQRVGLADALVGDPPLLVLDEPTAGLDPNQIRQVRALIRTLSENKTVLLSTHILPEVEALCDRVLILSKGELVYEGEPSEVEPQVQVRVVGRGDPEAYRAAFEPLDGMHVDRLEVGDGGLVEVRLKTPAAPDATERVFAQAVEAGLVLRELRQVSKSLEDVFAQLTTTEAGREGGDEEEE
jgi:ABC-2 type transport system ATP-binding protein